MEPEQMMAAVARSLAERTGKDLDAWVQEVEQAGIDPVDAKAVRAFLKQQGLAQNSQWVVADVVARRHGWTPPSATEYADQLYQGRKAALRPLHDAVAAAAMALGDDVQVQGRSTFVPFVRRTQFLAVAPGPRGTLRVGFRFRDDVPDAPELQPAKGFAQATHWVHLDPETTPADAAGLVEPLARAAYDQNG